MDAAWPRVPAAVSFAMSELDMVPLMNQGMQTKLVITGFRPETKKLELGKQEKSCFFGRNTTVYINHAIVFRHHSLFKKWVPASLPQAIGNYQSFVSIDTCAMITYFKKLTYRL